MIKNTDKTVHDGYIYKWCEISWSHKGHGNWRHGCRKCGALAR